MTDQLRDTASIRDFMTAMGQDVRDLPTVDVPDAERVLRGKLVIEEALELLEAMGLKLVSNGHQVHRSEVSTEIDEQLSVDLVEMAKESADLTYVNKGTMLAFGLPADEVFDAVHASNMSKLDDEGKPIRREDGKVIKGPNYQPADVAAIVRIPAQTDRS